MKLEDAFGLNADMTPSDVRWRIIRDREGYHPVCVQDLDLADYDASKWSRDNNGKVLEWATEGQAIEYLARAINKPRYGFEEVDAWWCREHETVHVGDRSADFTESHMGYMQRLYRKVLTGG